MNPISAPRCLGSAAIVEQGLGGGLKQEVVDESLVLEGQGSQERAAG